MFWFLEHNSQTNMALGKYFYPVICNLLRHELSLPKKLIILKTGRFLRDKSCLHNAQSTAKMCRLLFALYLMEIEQNHSY